MNDKNAWKETRTDWIQTRTGRVFELAEGGSMPIHIDDIAWALSMQCRYNGHCFRFYSVAEHSVLVAEILPEEFKLAGLLHDAAEAYIGDVVSPLKDLLPGYKEIEQRIEAAIADHFCLPPDAKEAVRRADLILLYAERECLMADCDRPWNLPALTAEEQSLMQMVTYRIKLRHQRDAYQPLNAATDFLVAFDNYSRS